MAAPPWHAVRHLLQPVTRNYAARNATTFNGISSLKLESDPLGSAFPNDSAERLARVIARRWSSAVDSVEVADAGIERHAGLDLRPRSAEVVADLGFQRTGLIERVGCTCSRSRARRARQHRSSVPAAHARGRGCGLYRDAKRLEILVTGTGGGTRRPSSVASPIAGRPSIRVRSSVGHDGWRGHHRDDDGNAGATAHLIVTAATASGHHGRQGRKETSTRHRARVSHSSH